MKGIEIVSCTNSVNFNSQISLTLRSVSYLFLSPKSFWFVLLLHIAARASGVSVIWESCNS